MIFHNDPRGICGKYNRIRFADGAALIELAAKPEPFIPEQLGEKASIVYRHWLAAHPVEGGLPGRHHIDPAEMAQALPNVWLVDVEREPRRFRYRLIGTGLYEGGVLAKVGDYVDQFDMYREAVGAMLSAVVDTGVPSYHRGPPLSELAREVRMLERLSLPLARDGRTVDMILNITVYDWQTGFSPPSYLSMTR